MGLPDERTAKVASTTNKPAEPQMINGRKRRTLIGVRLGGHVTTLRRRGFHRPRRVGRIARRLPYRRAPSPGPSVRCVVLSTESTTLARLRNEARPHPATPA